MRGLLLLMLVLVPRWTGAADRFQSPVYAAFRLIAGNGDAADRDGAFDQAAFDGPQGLELSADGRALYVADRGNHSIRRIRLDRQNAVETLSAEAGLGHALELALSADGKRLYAYDRDERRLQALDLARRQWGPAALPPRCASPDKQALLEALLAGYDPGPPSGLERLQGMLKKMSAGGQRAPVKGSFSFVYDAPRGVYYISEAGANRIVALRDDSPSTGGSPFLSEHPFAYEKPAGVTRILFFGSSILFASGEEEDDLGRSIPSQFEACLNLESALRGTGKQYEVIRDLARGEQVGSGEVYLRQHPGVLKQYHIDYVFFPVNDFSLWEDITAWSRVETQDDVPLATVDPEWSAKSLLERAAGMGPVLRRMVSTCRQDPDGCGGLITFDADGAPSFNLACTSRLSILENNRLRGYALQVEGKIAARAAAQCRQEGAQPLAWIFPARDYLGGGELSVICKTYPASLAALQAATSRAAGLPAIDLIEPLRAIQPQLFPMWSNHDQHLLYRAQKWVAYMMAEEFLKEEKAAF